MKQRFPSFPQGTLFPDSILVKLKPDEDFILMKTYCRKDGSRGNFLLSSGKLESWLESQQSQHKRELFLDIDCENFLAISFRGENLSFRTTWLSSYSDGHCQGNIQRFDVPTAILLDVLHSGTARTHLHHTVGNDTHFIAGAAQRTLQRIQKDKRMRRAFCKAMRDQLHWRGDTIRLYDDFQPGSFYFEASCGICGGLILHPSVLRNENGEFPKLAYSVHT